MIYVNGCSLTYGMELGTQGYKLHSDELTESENMYRKEHNWPGLLGKRLNLPVVNDAISGASNDRIYRTTIDSIESMSVLPEYVIIGWTSLGRVELFNLESNKEIQLTFRPDGQKTQQKYNRLSPILIEYSNNYIKNFLDYNWLAKKLAPQVIGLSSYLKLRGIPFIMFSGISNKMEKRGFDNYITKDLYTSVADFPIGEFLHPLEDGHKFWANKMFEAIDEECRNSTCQRQKYIF